MHLRFVLSGWCSLVAVSAFADHIKQQDSLVILLLFLGLDKVPFCSILKQE